MAADTSVRFGRLCRRRVRSWLASSRLVVLSSLLDHRGDPMRSAICLALLLTACQPTPADYAVERVFDRITGQQIPPAMTESLVRQQPQQMVANQQPIRLTPPPSELGVSNESENPSYPETEPPEEPPDNAVISATSEPLPPLERRSRTTRPSMPKDDNRPILKANPNMADQNYTPPTGNDMLSQHIPCDQLPSSANCSSGGQ